MFWTTLLSTLITTAATSAPLGAALGLTGLIILQFFVNGATSLALNAVWNVLNEFTLSAIPLFIIMGEVMLASESANESMRLYQQSSIAFQETCYTPTLQSVQSLGQSVAPASPLQQPLEPLRIRK